MLNPSLTAHAALPERVDVAIVGGGIQGVAVAQASAAAGFSTLLIEKKEWGWATSSSSSKLVHGGLRYLQTAQFHLVKECLHERDWMLKNCPQLVTANWFYVPIYQQNTYSRFMIMSGLILYKLLNWGSRYSGFRCIPKKEWAGINGLKQEGLLGVFAYQDAQTHDQQLTQAIQRSAEHLGAICHPHAELITAEKNRSGYQLRIKRAAVDRTESISCRVLVNASGPWVNKTLSLVQPPVTACKVDLIQGTHIVIDQAIHDYGFYVEAPKDKRAVFILPWQGGSLIGTTETLFTGEPGEHRPTEEELTYLEETLRYYFPQLIYKKTGQFCGLRVLPKRPGAAFSRPRDVMLDSKPGLISLYGGKLTAWRVTAKSVLTIVQGQLGQRAVVDTRQIMLPNIDPSITE